MAATASLGWSGDVKSKRSGRPSTKRQIWTVIGALTEDEAYAAAGLPDIDDELEPGSEYRVSNLRAYHGSGHGPLTWAIDVDFDIPQDGSFDPYQNPLNRPYELTWGESTISVPMEYDYYGRLLKNSAGDFFDPLPTREITVDTLRVTKWFATYDRSLSRALRNCVNTNQLTVAGTVVLPYEMLCRRIIPIASYTTKARYVQVAFDFEMCTEFRSMSMPNVSGYPFDAHLVDKGRRGWYDDGSGTVKKGFFCVAKGTGAAQRAIQILGDDVLLDGIGTPVDSNIKVADSDDPLQATVYAPFPNPNAVEHMTGDYESPFDVVGAPTIDKPKIWLYAKVGEADFSILPFAS